jgi:hypothetical protein
MIGLVQHLLEQQLVHLMGDEEEQFVTLAVLGAELL